MRHRGIELGAGVELHLRIRVRPERTEELLAFLREAIPFYERPGGIRVRLMREASDPGRFIEVVEYASEEAYSRDQARVADDAEMKSYLQRWRALLEEPPGVEVYRRVG